MMINFSNFRVRNIDRQRIQKLATIEESSDKLSPEREDTLLTFEVFI